MNRNLLFISTLVLAAWLYFFLVSVGKVDAPSLLDGVRLPKTMAELGDSLGVINGLMSSLAVVLALVTLAQQRKDAQRAKKDQNMATRMLSEQLANQNEANQIMADQLTNQYRSMRQSYLVAEEARLQGILERIDGDHRKAELWTNVVKRKNKVLRELELLNQRLSL